MGVGRMAPDHVAARVGLGRHDDLRSAQFLVALGRQVHDDQVARIGEQEEAILVRRDA